MSSVDPPGAASAASAGPAAGVPLASDLGRALRALATNRPAWGYAALQALVVGYLLARRPWLAPELLVIGTGLLAFGFLAWYAGRSPRARPDPLPIRSPRGELAGVTVAVAGVLLYVYAGWLDIPWQPLLWAVPVGGAIVVASALMAGATVRDLLGWVLLSWLPFLPFLALIAIFKAPILGLSIVPLTAAALVSGMLQQILLQVGLEARLEGALGRADVAILLAGLVFGLAHVAMNLEQAGGDWSIALANALVLQANIGVVCCLAFTRHRAALALGFAHALFMA
jgi:hypothetical protein